MSYVDIYKAAKAEGRLENLTPKFVSFKDKHDKIIGKYISHTSVKSSQGEGVYNQYLFDTDIGLVKFHLGGATDNEIVPSLKQNYIYCIEYLGKEQLDKLKTVNKFKVEVISITGGSE